jgi:hypothetical protein
MKKSYCLFDGSSGRYVLEGRDLHCGDCFQILTREGWRDVRIEMSGQRWYLVGVGNGNSTEPGAYEARRYP